MDLKRGERGKRAEAVEEHEKTVYARREKGEAVGSRSRSWKRNTKQELASHHINSINCGWEESTWRGGGMESNSTRGCRSRSRSRTRTKQKR